MARTKRLPLTGVSRVMNDNGVYVYLHSLPTEEVKKSMQKVNENAIRASAAYHGFNVRFEGDTAILTERNVN